MLCALEQYQISNRTEQYLIILFTQPINKNKCEIKIILLVMFWWVLRLVIHFIVFIYLFIIGKNLIFLLATKYFSNRGIYVSISQQRSMHTLVCNYVANLITNYKVKFYKSSLLILCLNIYYNFGFANQFSLDILKYAERNILVVSLLFYISFVPLFFHQLSTGLNDIFLQD